jgi:hypothetical protein
MSVKRHHVVARGAVYIRVLINSDEGSSSETCIQVRGVFILNSLHGKELLTI